MDAALLRLEALQLAQASANRSYNGRPIDPLHVVESAKLYEAYVIGSQPEPEKRNEIDKMEVAARAAHEAIRTLQIENNEPNVASPWETVGEDIKSSCFIGITRVLENPDITNEELHNSWIETKKSQGWKYGEVRSEEDKLHPCMVPYSELPAFQRLKDAMFRNVVKAVLGL